MKRLRTTKAYLVLTLILGVFILPGCGDWDKPGTTPVPAGTPSVTVVTPANGVTVLPDTELITATFDMAMDGTTLSEESFTLSCAGNPVLGGVVTYSATDNKATLTLPAGDLPSPAECTATISTAAKEEAGTALAQDHVWTFFISDTTLPTVTDVTPVAESAVLPDTKLITAAFDKVMDPATLTAESFTLSCDGNQILGGVVTYAATDNKATLTLPATDLPSPAECTATITTAAKDETGNALALDYVWIFTITDIALPTVTDVTPLDGETVLPDTKLLTAIFDKAMDATTLTLDTFTLACDGTPVTADSVTYSAVDDKATLELPATTDLPNSAECTATITTGVMDLAGNALAEDYVWNFLISDAILPQVTETTPETMNPGPTPDVAIETLITATFDTDMNPLTVTADSFTLTTGSGVDLMAVASTFPNVSYDNVTRTATFHPANDLNPGETYTATIFGTGVNAVTDTDGNALAGDSSFPLVANDYVWSFTTMAAEVPPPLSIMSFGIASYGGITNIGATKINGNVVLNPTANCNLQPILFEDGPGFGVCGGDITNVPTVNEGDLVITPSYPDTVTAPVITAELVDKWNSISPALLQGATVLGCGTIGDAGDAGALIGCSGNPVLPPGTYISATGTTISVGGILTLDAAGDANAEWYFQAPSALDLEVGSEILLTGGAKASNVWWFVGSSATIKTNSTSNGNVLASASISMQTGATSCGSLLAGAEGSGAFTFLENTVSVPGHTFAPTGCE